MNVEDFESSFQRGCVVRMYHSRFFQLFYAFSLVCMIRTDTVYKDCGSPSGKIVSVSVDECPNGPICTLKSGTNVTLTVEFTALTDTTKLKSVVHGIIGGIPLPFPLPSDDGCVDSGITCPVNHDQSYTYSSILQILTSYPKIRVVVKWELKDETGKDVFCVLIPAAIQ